MVAFNKILFAVICLTLALAMSAHPAAADEAEIQEFLDGHNKARAEVGVPPVVWNTSLEAFARNWANERSKDCALEHSNGPYGESIATGGILQPTDAINMWMSEKPFYNPTNGECKEGEICGHFTNIVFRYTISIGCARVQCENTWIFIICNYFAPPADYSSKIAY